MNSYKVESKQFKSWKMKKENCRKCELEKLREFSFWQTSEESRRAGKKVQAAVTINKIIFFSAY